MLLSYAPRLISHRILGDLLQGQDGVAFLPCRAVLFFVRLSERKKY
jgi:hypothetical protein